MSRSNLDAFETALAFGVLFVTATLVLITPWVYGGVEEWFRAFQAVLLALAIVATAGALLLRPSLQSSQSNRILFAAISPALILLLVASVQLCSSDATASSLEPLGSIYPAATRIAVAGILSILAGLLLGSLIFSREPLFSALLLACLASAASVAFFGIAMRLTGDDRIIRGLTVFGDPFARFVNRNNAASFMLLGLSSGLTLLCKMSRRAAACDESAITARALIKIDRTTFVAIVGVLTTLCLGGILACRSRGGLIAAAVAVIAGLLFMQSRNTAAKFVFALSVFLGAAGLVSWLGLAESALVRFEELQSNEVLSSGRIPHWIDAADAFWERPVLGFGLGTYGYAHSPYSKHVSELWYEHADNQFVELAVETGIVGLGSLLVCFAITAIAIMTNPGPSRERVLLISLIAGQSVHSLFDYGIIIPAVSLPVSILWSSAVVRLMSRILSGVVQRCHIAGRATGSILCGVVAAGLMWSYVEHRDAWAVDRDSVDANRLVNPEAFSAEALSARIQRLERSLDLRPDDAEGQRSLAQLLVYRYRSTTFETLKLTDPDLSPKVAWNATNLTSLHKAATALARAGAVRGIEALRADPLTEANLLPARQHYEKSLAACKTLPGAHLPLNALRFTAEGGGDVLATTELLEALDLFPTDIGLLRTAGKMAWHAGNREVAKECWQRAFGLSNDGFGPTIKLVSEEDGAAAATELLLPSSAETALSVVLTPEVLADHSLCLEIALRLEDLAQPLPDKLLRHRLTAIAAWFKGEDKRASTLFSDAVALAPFDAATRADRARFEWYSGRRRVALDELETAISLQPDRDDLRRLFASWEALWQQSVTREGVGSP